MKTSMTIVAVTTAALCGCRMPNALSSSVEPGEHALSSEEAALVLEASALEAQTPRAGEAAGTDVAVPELLSRAEQAIQAQQLVVARSHLQSILADQPDHPRAHHLLAVVCDLDGQFSQAEQHYFAALAQDPQNARIVGDLGYSYYLQSRLGESEHYLQRALELDPGYASAARNLAQLYSDRGDAARAESLIGSPPPPSAAEAAREQIYQQPHQNEPAGQYQLLANQQAEPTGNELARQILEEIQATDREVPDAIPQAGEYGVGEMHARMRPPSAMSAPVGSVPASTPPMSNHAGVPAAADSFPVINPNHDAGNPSPTGESSVIEPAMGTRTANQTQSGHADRRWPPATWAPLSDVPASSTDPPPYRSGGINQVTGTISPWNNDVRQVADEGSNLSVDRAYYQRDAAAGTALNQIQPVSEESANARGATSTPLTPSYPAPEDPRRRVSSTATSEAGTPWSAGTTRAAGTSEGWIQELPNTGGSTTISTETSRSGVVYPEPYHGRQSASGYEHYRIPSGDMQPTSRRY